MVTANKEKYRNLCEKEEGIPFFSQAWWLDTVAGDDWDVALVEKNSEIQASLPFVIRRKMGMTILSQPALTQSLGPWIRSKNLMYSKDLANEKKMMQELIANMPAFTRYQQNWDFKITNWLPFYWAGFEQTVRYTYRINSLSNLDQVWSSIQKNIKGDIRKADAKNNIRIRTDLNIDHFISLNEKVFHRQGKALPYSREFVRAIDQKTKEKNVSRIFIAEDGEGRHHAGVYIIWDKNSAYYLMGGGDPKLRNSGATSLCMWEAIKFASTVTESFDFEGSMIEPIERFFRAFGAVQTPYFEVSRTPSKFIKLLTFMKNLR